MYATSRSRHGSEQKAKMPCSTRKVDSLLRACPLPIGVVLLLIICFSSTSPSSAFFTAAFTSAASSSRAVGSIVLAARKNNSKNNDQTKNQSSWSQANSAPYTPLGLSPEEYAKIKKSESDEVSKKDFGAWGPRFKRSLRPDGDWLVMTDLWTRGFDSNASAVNGVDGRKGAGGKVSRVLRVFGPAFLLSYLVVTAFSTCIGLTKAAVSGSSEAKSMNALFQLAVKLISVKEAGFFALQGLLGAVLTRPLINFVGYMNRKRLWSPRRTKTTVLLASVALVLGWIGLLTGTSNLYVFSALLKLS